MGTMGMKLGQLDLSPEKYMLVYKRKDDGTINTWTLPEVSFQINYKQMKKDVEFVGIYKKLTNDELLDVLTN